MSPMTEVVFSQKEEEASAHRLSVLREDAEKAAIYKPGRDLSPETELSWNLILDFSASRTVRNTFLVFMSPHLWYPVRQP